jgi:hypothetical protein
MGLAIFKGATNMKSSALLITAMTLVSEPTWAQPPNEVYSFDVISDTLTELPACQAGCPVPVPYHLASLTVTHEAFAPNHAASLTATYGMVPADDNGVVSFTVNPIPFSNLNYPLPAGPGYSINIKVQLSGNDISGSIEGHGPTPGAGSLSMNSGIDEHWLGQYGQFGAPTYTHTFTAVVTRVPQGQVSR